MAKENVTKFEELLRSDEDLQAKLKSAAEAAGDLKDEETKFNTIIAPLAEDNGLPFTFDELKSAIDEGMEMSEDELKALAGGQDQDDWSICIIIGGGGTDASWTEDDDEGGGACYYVGVLLLGF